MIDSFADKITGNVFNGTRVKKLPPDLIKTAQRKLQYLNAAVTLNDLRVPPPGNRLKALKGDLKGFHAIRINDQFRIVFTWANGLASRVQIKDYH